MVKEAQTEPIKPESGTLEEESRWRKTERGYKGIIARQSKELQQLRGATPEDLPNATASGKHDFSPAFPTCLTCGAENPDYRVRPVRCSNKECQTALGTERVLSKIDRCPACGNTEAEVYNEQEKE